MQFCFMYLKSIMIDKLSVAITSKCYEYSNIQHEIRSYVCVFLLQVDNVKTFRFVCWSLVYIDWHQYMNTSGMESQTNNVYS